MIHGTKMLMVDLVRCFFLIFLEVMREVIDGERRKEIPGYTTDAILFELGPFKQNHLITARIEKGVDLNNLANTAGFIDND